VDCFVNVTNIFYWTNSQFHSWLTTIHMVPHLYRFPW
jgi:hypothetical protein